MKFTGRAYGVTTARRATPRRRSNPEWGAKGYRVQVLDTINDDKVVQDIRGDGKEQARFEAFLARYDYPRYVVQIVDNATDEIVQDNQGSGGSVRRFGARANPPMLAILNPLPPHLERFAKAQRLNADEREELNQAIARYCEFHDVSPDDIKIEPWGEVEGDAKRFLVGLGKAEDVSYSANTKDRFRGSNKKGTPFRHEIEAPDTMLATTPDGEMTIIINKPGAKKKLVVQDWMRG